MKELTTHIEVENYDETIEKLGNVDFLNPIKINDHLKNFETNIIEKKNIKKPTKLWKILKITVRLNSLIPIFIYQLFLPKIKEIEFIATAKFAVGITAFPLFYLLQSLIISHIFGVQIAIIYALISIILVLLLAKSK